MCNAGGSGALLAFGAFERLGPAFVPTPTPPDPPTTREARRAPDANDWMAAMDAEIDNIRSLNISKEVPRPNSKNIITPKSVFRRKYENDSLTEHKAQLVVCGFAQVSGIAYREAHLYAPVVRHESFRALISTAVLFDRQFDVSASHPHRYIDGEAYMEPPLGYERQGTVWLLHKGLDRLKQAGRIWHERLNNDMEELGFMQCQRDHAVLRIGEWRSRDWAVCAFCVDDETGVGSHQRLDRVSSVFSQKCGISGEREMRWTPGIRVARDRNTHTILLSQE